MNAQHRHQPSRRTVVRAAAWTAPAVSIAVAAPALAASPGVTLGSATASGSRAAKDLYPHVVVVAGPSGLTTITAVLTISPGALDHTWSRVGGGWRMTASTATSATYSYTGRVAPGQGVRFDPYVRLASNDPEAVQVTVTFSWTGGGTVAGISLHK